MRSYLLKCIYLKSSFRYVDILWHNVQTGDSQNLNTSSVYCRSCLKHTYNSLINAIDLMVLTSDSVKIDFFFTVSIQCLVIGFVT